MGGDARVDKGGAGGIQVIIYGAKVNKEDNSILSMPHIKKYIIFKLIFLLLIYLQENIQLFIIYNS